MADAIMNAPGNITLGTTGKEGILVEPVNEECRALKVEPVVKQSPLLRMCNLSGSVSERQARHFLELVSPVKEYVMYPKDRSIPTTTKVAYFRFNDPEAYKCAIHLTGTLLLDRTVIVSIMSKGIIPDEATAISIATQLSSSEISMAVSGGFLEDGGINISLNFGFPYVPYAPTLPDHYNHRKITDARRTIFIHNIHQDVSAEILLTLFSQVGEVRYVRIYDDETTPESKCSYIEFSEAATINPALQFHEFPLFGKPIYITYSRIYISKQDEEMRRRSPIGRFIRKFSPERGYRRRSPIRRRSRSPVRRRSRSPPIRRRSRTPPRKRSRSPSRRRSRSPRKRSSERRSSRRSKRSNSIDRGRSRKSRRREESEEKVRHETELKEKSRKRKRSGSRSQSKSALSLSSEDRGSVKNRRNESKKLRNKRERKNSRSHNSASDDKKPEEMSDYLLSDFSKSDASANNKKKKSKRRDSLSSDEQKKKPKSKRKSRGSGRRSKRRDSSSVD